MPLAPGTKLGTYEVLGPLGAGAMGEVYRARDLRLGREVAIKLLPEQLASDPDRLTRFEREARLVAAVNHPNVVTLYSVEDRDGIRFLTMELVEGRPLTASVLPGGLSVGKLLELAIPLTDALVAAHAKGVVHRDLKPGNVMVTLDGRIKVLDFGLARLAGDEAPPELSQSPTMSEGLSIAGAMVGTAPYMSPEQVRGKTADARSDLFALGIILYELATGRRPFLGASVAEVTSAILRDDPPSSGSLRSDLPHDLTRIVSRCLEKDPARRIQTARDVLNELDLVRQEMAARTRGTSAPREGARQGADPSIAVLPFENRSQVAEDEIFADGMTEDVIAQLCKVRNLKVISRTSVMPFKGHRDDLQAIATKLGVTHILEGSIRRAGDRVRIVAQLVDPESGRTRWAETYDRQLIDIFEIQTDVALQLSTALKTELTANERKRIAQEPTRDVAAYELYLHGRKHLLMFDVEGNVRAADFFQQAIARDPGFAQAYAGLAIALTELADHGARDRSQVGPAALAAGEKAVALDPELTDGHCALAFACGVIHMDHARAEAEFRRALELSPGNSFACDLYGRLCAGLGRFDEAIALQERSQELDPLVHRTDLATSLMRAGRNDDAVRIAQRAVLMDPRYARGHATLGWALFRQGNRDPGIVELERATEVAPGEDIWLGQLGQACALAGDRDRALEILRRLEDPARSSPASPYHLAYIHTGLGDLDRAMDCLERAYASGTGSVYSIKGSFLFAPLRDHPRFTALLERMGIA